MILKKLLSFHSPTSVATLPFTDTKFTSQYSSFSFEILQVGCPNIDILAIIHTYMIKTYMYIQYIQNIHIYIERERERGTYTELNEDGDGRARRERERERERELQNRDAGIGSAAHRERESRRGGAILGMRAGPVREQDPPILKPIFF